jgi:hypothetical protein
LNSRKFKPGSTSLSELAALRGKLGLPSSAICGSRPTNNVGTATSRPARREIPTVKLKKKPADQA